MHGAVWGGGEKKKTKKKRGKERKNKKRIVRLFNFIRTLHEPFLGTDIFTIFQFSLRTVLNFSSFVARFKMRIVRAINKLSYIRYNFVAFVSSAQLVLVRRGVPVGKPLARLRMREKLHVLAQNVKIKDINVLNGTVLLLTLGQHNKPLLQ